MYIAIAFFLLLSFFLSGSETALTAANKMKIRTRAESGDKASQKLLQLTAKPDELITAILIGNNIANIMLPTLVTMVAINHGINVGIATGVLTVVLIIFAEVLPKSIAATFAEKVAYTVYPIIRLLVVLLKPLTFLLSKFTRWVIRLLAKSGSEQATVSKEELIAMVDIATSEGLFRTGENSRIKGAISFQNLDVRDALKTPRMEIIGIQAESPYEEARDIVLAHHYTRYPVYKDDMDNICGVFHSKKLISWSLEPEKPLEDFMDDEPLFVYEFHPIERVFALMLKERKHVAVVLDEYGGTVGLITNEDIIEAMIGLEIKDEKDTDEEVLIDKLTDHHVICHGKLSLHRLNEVFKTKIPEEEDVLAGFLLKEMGRFPAEGDTFDYQHLTFKVLRIQDNQLRRIEITKKTSLEIMEERS